MRTFLIGTILSLSVSFLFSQSLRGSEYIKENAISVANRVLLNDAVYEKIKNYKAILLGEMPGTIEAPEFVLGLTQLLSQKGKKVVVGLEIERKYQYDLGMFFQTGNAKALKASGFFKGPLKDGRSSTAMANLIQRLRGKPNIKLICYAPDTSWGGDSRDSLMADQLDKAMKNYPDHTLIALSGNIQSKISPVSWEGKVIHPLGFFLHQLPGATLKPNEILSLIHMFYEGTAWNCQEGKCGAYEMGGTVSRYNAAVDYENYFYLEKNLTHGFHGVVFSRTIRASGPYVQ